jgi:PAS domain S-box-containing protein
MMLPGVVLLLIAFGWYIVLRQTEILTQTTIAVYQQTELAMVRAVARSVEQYVSEQIEEHSRTDVAEFEQEIFERFIAPIHLLKNGDAWIYAPDHVVFDRSSDFPQAYRGKSMAQIFAIQAKQGASHYQEMTEAVMNAREGVGWYIWLPDKGREIAAWTPVAIGNLVWIIGLSTPLPEIMESTGAASQIRTSVVTMTLASGVALVLLTAWVISTSRRKQAEAALAEEHGLLRTFIDNIPEAIYVKDTESRFLIANKVVAQLMGTTPDKLIGRTDFDFYSEELAREYYADEQVILTSGQALINKDEPNVDPFGHKCWILTTKVPFRDSQGKIKGLVGIGRDTTERKGAEEALRQSQQKYASLVDSLDGIVWEADAQTFAFNFVSHQAERLLGYPVERWLTEPAFWKDHIHPADQEWAVNFCVQSTQEKRPHDFEYRMLAADGRIIWLRDIVTVMVENDHPVRLRGVMIDITEHKRIEAEREALIAELEAKNDELERFTYTISHDLKSPLVTIQGFLGYVEQAALSGDMQRMQADLARISNAADKMQRLLDELLELSRIGRLTNPVKAVPLSQLAREAVELVAGPLAQRGVEVDIAPDLPLVYGDHSRLREALQNLVDNAVKYMGDQPQPRVEIGGRLDGSQMVIYVRDNGIGIDPANHDKVFGLFTKLDQKSEGTGLGLAIVKRIVEAHGGRIWVESDSGGQGSTFCLTLPDGTTNKQREAKS